MQFATGSYTGNGVDDRWINDPAFQPDLVIVRADAASLAVWRSSTMAAGDSAAFSSAVANLTNRIQQFGAEGFQVGSAAEVNTDTVAYYWAAFKDIGNDDFQVGTYTGDGNDNRNITGVGFDPTLVWVKADAANVAVWRVDEHAGDDCSLFSSNANVSDRIQSLITDGFQVGTAAEVNTNAATYHYVAFKDTTGHIETGSYTGDGNDDRSITVGFSPDLAFVKVDGGVVGALRVDTMDTGDSAVFSAASAPSANLIQAFEANGFQVGTHNAVNANGGSYYWAAWKVGVSPAAIGSLCWGEQSPTGGEVPVSWATWSDGAAGSPTISGDADWGKLQLGGGDEGRSPVYDFGNNNTRTYTLTENRYGAGQGAATLQIRGSNALFAQDDALPAWNNYTGPIQGSTRYIQVRENK